jgi:hypothetical protein
MLQVYNDPMGESSPNLVTLSGFEFQFYFAAFSHRFNSKKHSACYDG